MILGLLYSYIAMVLVVFLHEVGHLPKQIKIIRWFPIPEGASISAFSRFGGLIVNVIIFISIFYMQPENLFIQTIGLVAWIHFIFYSILGSFNHEPRIPRWAWKYWVFDDVPNAYWWIFVPTGIITFWIFAPYYIPIIKILIAL